MDLFRAADQHVERGRRSRDRRACSTPARRRGAARALRQPLAQADGAGESRAPAAGRRRDPVYLQKVTAALAPEPGEVERGRGRPDRVHPCRGDHERRRPAAGRVHDREIAELLRKEGFGSLVASPTGRPDRGDAGAAAWPRRGSRSSSVGAHVRSNSPGGWSRRRCCRDIEQQRLWRPGRRSPTSSVMPSSSWRRRALARRGVPAALRRLRGVAAARRAAAGLVRCTVWRSIEPHLVVLTFLTRAPARPCRRGVPSAAADPGGPPCTGLRTRRGPGWRLAGGTTGPVLAASWQPCALDPQQIPPEFLVEYLVGIALATQPETAAGSRRHR